MLDANTFILLVALACLVCMLTKWLRIPYTIALVFMGLIVSLNGQQAGMHLTEELLLTVFLPALLFEAAWNLHVRYLKQHWLPIVVLSILGLLISIAAVGFSLSWGLQYPLLISLLFGAMISATDPVSVVALFRQLNISPRLATIVEAESLFNDGTAVVAFQLILGMVLAGNTTMQSPGTLALTGIIQFFEVAAGGILVGCAYGFFFSWLISKFNDHLLELMFTVLVAYGSYITADQIGLPGAASIHLSGVLATVSAGLVMGGICENRGISESTLSVINSFWEFAAFFVNSILFLLIGLTIHLDFLMANWQAVGIAIVAVLFARALSVFALVPVLNRFGFGKKKPISFSWQTVLVWGGLRGALSMALALSLPTTMPERPLILAMVFGVVLFSLLVQGLSIPTLLKKLGLYRPADLL
jgi:CPA1 family monovalent cation:H+ antiporter